MIKINAGVLALLLFSLMFAIAPAAIAAAEKAENDRINFEMLPDYIIKNFIISFLDDADFLHFLVTTKRFKNLLSEDLAHRFVNYWSHPDITCYKLGQTEVGLSYCDMDFFDSRYRRFYVWGVDRFENSVYLMDNLTREPFLLTEPIEDSNSIRRIVSSPDGKMIAFSREKDSRIFLLNRENHEPRELKGQDASAQVLTFSLNSKVLAAGCGSDVVLWNVESGEILKKLKGNSNVNVDPFGEIMLLEFVFGGKMLAFQYCDRERALWAIYPKSRQ